MQMPGSAISPDVSNVLYPYLGLQALIIFAAGLIAFFAIWRLNVFSASGAVMFGHQVSLGSLRELVLPNEAKVATTEPRTIKVVRIGFGLLWIFDAILQAKPAMPSEMVSQIIAPALTNQPGPLAWLMRGGVYFWRFNPIAADAATVWIQAGIGFLLLFGSRRPVRTLAAITSIAWGSLIWVFGEGLGMLLVPGASVLSGTPGAAFFYVIGGALLLLDDSVTASESFYRLAKRVIGGFWIVMAVIQALPFEGFWSGSALSSIFQQMSGMVMPSYLTAPISFMAKATAANPALWNFIFVAILAIVGLGILFAQNPRNFLIGSFAFSFATWWIGMGFGFLGATGTDPNSSLPIVVLSGGLLLITARAPTPRSTNLFPGNPKALGVLMAIIALAVAVVPMLASLPAAASDSSIYAAVSDGGGLTDLGGRAAPNFSLVDQYGKTVSLASFSHKALVITFLDPVCYDVCPVISGEIAKGISSLGKTGANVAMIAIDINPSFTSIRAIRQFDVAHGLNTIPNWYYLTGSLSELTKVWKNYLVSPTVGPIGMLSHPQVVYFIDTHDRELALTGDSGSGQAPLAASYSNLIASTTRIALKS